MGATTSVGRRLVAMAGRPRRSFRPGGQHHSALAACVHPRIERSTLVVARHALGAVREWVPCAAWSVNGVRVGAGRVPFA